MPTTLPLQFGLPGGPELLIILGIAVLLFGANKLPALARSSGQAMGEFKRGRQELENELKKGAETGTDEKTAADAVPEIETEGEPEEIERPVDADLAS